MIDWEPVYSETNDGRILGGELYKQVTRAPVEGGWLYLTEIFREETYASSHNPNEPYEDYVLVSSSTAFVPSVPKGES